MKALTTTVVSGRSVAAFIATSAAPRPDDNLPVLKPKELLHINPKWCGASAVAFSPDGKRVVAASRAALIY